MVFLWLVVLAGWTTRELPFLGRVRWWLVVLVDEVGEVPHLLLLYTKLLVFVVENIPSCLHAQTPNTINLLHQLADLLGVVLEAVHHQLQHEEVSRAGGGHSVEHRSVAVNLSLQHVSTEYVMYVRSTTHTLVVLRNTILV